MDIRCRRMKLAGVKRRLKSRLFWCLALAASALVLCNCVLLSTVNIMQFFDNSFCQRINFLETKQKALFIYLNPLHHCIANDPWYQGAHHISKCWRSARLLLQQRYASDGKSIAGGACLKGMSPCHSIHGNRRSWLLSSLNLGFVIHENSRHYVHYIRPQVYTFHVAIAGSLCAYRGLVFIKCTKMHSKTRPPSESADNARIQLRLEVEIKRRLTCFTCVRIAHIFSLYE